jgi:ABC-type transporter Mla subunit MlaD
MGRETFLGVLLLAVLALLLTLILGGGFAIRALKGRVELHAYFTSVNNLRVDGEVRYNGLNIGRIKGMSLAPLTEESLAEFPEITRAHLDHLPITSLEKSLLLTLPPEEFNTRARALILGRSMVRLELEVARQEHQFRMDDQIEVSASVLGEAALNILAGSGEPIQEGQRAVYLGRSGDIYERLGKGMDQVRNMVKGMADAIGDREDSPLARKIQHWEGLTGRIDKLAGDLEEKLPEMWDTTDEKLDQFSVQFNELEEPLGRIEPVSTKKLNSAREELEKLRASVDQMHAKGLEGQRKFRENLDKGLEPIGKVLREHRRPTTTWVEDLHEAEQMLENKSAWVEREMEALNRSLGRGLSAVLQTLRNFTGLGDLLARKSWMAAKHPWTLSSAPQGRWGDYLEAEFKTHAMRWHYRTLAEPLQALPTSVQPPSNDARERLARMAEMQRQIEAFLMEPVRE